MEDSTVNTTPINQQTVIQGLEARASKEAGEEYLSLIYTTECGEGNDNVPKYEFLTNKLPKNILKDEIDRFQELIDKINELICNNFKLQKGFLNENTNENKTELHPEFIEHLEESKKEDPQAQNYRNNPWDNANIERGTKNQKRNKWASKDIKPAGPVAPPEDKTEEEEPMKKEDIPAYLDGDFLSELDVFQKDIKKHLGNILKHIVHDRTSNNVPNTSTVTTEEEDSYKAIEEFLDSYNSLFKDQDGGSVVSQRGGYKWNTFTKFLFKKFGRYSLESIATLSNPKNLIKIPKLFKGFFKARKGFGLITGPIGVALSLALMGLTFSMGIAGFVGINAGLFAVGGSADAAKGTIQLLIKGLKRALGGTSVTVPKDFFDPEGEGVSGRGRNYKRKSKKHHRKSKKQRKKSKKQLKKSRKQRKKSRKQRKSTLN